MKRPTFSRWGFFPLFLVVLLGSCSVRKTIYFNDLLDSTHVVRTSAQFIEPVIQEDDILQISIQTLDPGSAALANQSGSAGSEANQGAGFLVDKKGYVHMTLLGKVEVKGLTTYQARERITSMAKQYYKEPTVQVRFANFKITVLGEVNRPSTYTVPTEKVSVIDAIGLAGDLTIFGKRENVLLVRDLEGKKEMVRLNLNSSDIFQSPYFYLRQNDVLYVEPGKAKGTANNAPLIQTVGIMTSIISLALLAITRL